MPSVASHLSAILSRTHLSSARSHSEADGRPQASPFAMLLDGVGTASKAPPAQPSERPTRADRSDSAASSDHGTDANAPAIPDANKADGKESQGTQDATPDANPIDSNNDAVTAAVAKDAKGAKPAEESKDAKETKGTKETKSGRAEKLIKLLEATTDGNTPAAPDGRQDVASDAAALPNPTPDQAATDVSAADLAALVAPNATAGQATVADQTAAADKNPELEALAALQGTDKRTAVDGQIEPAQVQARTQDRAQAQAPGQTQAQDQAQAQIQDQAKAQAQVPAQDQSQVQGQGQGQDQDQAQAQAQAQGQAQAQAQAQAQGQAQTQAQGQDQSKSATGPDAAATPGAGHDKDGESHADGDKLANHVHRTADELLAKAGKDAPAQMPGDTTTAVKSSADAPQNPGLWTQPTQANAGAANTNAATAPQTVAVPLAGLAIEIATQAHAGKQRFDIRLDPPELGRIDVRLDVDRDGHVTSRLVVDRVETLDLLKRDSAELQRALQQAGLKTADNALEFSLRQQAFAREDTGAQNAARLIVPEDDPAPLEAMRQGYGRLLGLGGGLDIRV